MSAIAATPWTDDGYLEFLSSKFHFDYASGFEVEPSDISPLLHRHQPEICRWMLKKGRAALFARFGLGKTLMQLQVMELIRRHQHGLRLIVIPLGVRQEFVRDAAKLGVEVKFIRANAEIDGDHATYVTNYESVRDGKLDVAAFIAVSLDEASVLRSFGSKTYQEFLQLFAETQYRFVATATPSPNRYKELIHYAGFLGVMDTGQALTRFFQRNSSKAGDLTLYPHMQQEFFLWLHSWACFIQRPSDLGHSDDGYDLPPVRVHWHEVKVDNLTGGEERDGQGVLIRDPAMGLSEAASAKRDSLALRVEKAREIVDLEPGRHVVIWHDLEAERHALKAAIPDMIEVYGSMPDLEVREQLIVDFSDGKIVRLGTKPSISGSGCNFQRHCSMAVFTGIGFEFNDFIQAFHRIVRFQQTEACDVHIIYSELERGIREVLERKWADHDHLAEIMSRLLRAHGLSTEGLERELSRTIDIERRVEIGELYSVAHNDCVAECHLMASDSADLIHSSIPFGTQYEYCESYRDFGHNADNDAFWRQMDHLTPQLLRILKPGRVAAIHVKDRVLFGNVTGDGFPTIEPFHAECIFHFRKHGFRLFGQITIVTDVVRENNTNYRLGWTENGKDSTKMGVGSPEYVLLFRKMPTDRSDAYADEPVTKIKPDCMGDDGNIVPWFKGGEIIPGNGYSRARWQIDAHGFWRSSGNRLLTREELGTLGPDKLASAFPKWTAQQVYDHEDHVAIGEALEAKSRLPSKFGAILPGSWHPDVWTDVNRMLTLNGEQAAKGRELHVCPLQLDIIERIIRRYSNPGELVFDPFGGIGSVPATAIKLGRRGAMAELEPKYIRDAIRYLRAAEDEARTPTLFDLLGAVA